MVRLALTSCFFVIVLLAGCTEGGSTGSTGGMGGSGGDGGDPNSITVEGQMFYEGGYGAAEGALVLLNGDLAKLVSTDSNGSFRFTGVVPPYDLTVIHSIGVTQRLIEFKGLTRANPALSLSGAVDFERSAIMQGVIGGVAYPLSTDAEIRVSLTQVESDIHVGTGSGNVKAFGSITWKGPASYSGSLVGVLTQNRPEGGLDFLQAGSITPFEIEEGAERSVGLVLDQTIETEVTTISAEAGAYTYEWRTVIGSFDVLGATLPGDLFEDRPTLPKVVSIPAGGARIILRGFLPNHRAAAVIAVDAVPGGETVLALPPEVVLDTLSPDDGEEVSTFTPRLEWIPVPGATAYVVDVQSSTAFGRWVLPPGVTFLDVPDHGEDLFRLPSDAPPIWWMVVAKMTPASSPDELADPEGMGTPPYWETGLEYMAQGTFSIVP